MFEVGQKVVCVEAEASCKYMPPGIISNRDLDELAEGAVYTIRKIGVVYGDLCVWLDEITRPEHVFWGGEAPYDARRFRPVVERKTDISVFTAMLHRAPADLLADLRKLEQKDAA